MKCAFNPTRIERCLVCHMKCDAFMAWYRVNKQCYVDLVEDYVTRFPDKYDKEYVIMARKTDTQSPDQSRGKMLAIVDENSTIVKIVSRESLSGQGILQGIQGNRLIELTGKEYEVIVSISLKAKELNELSAANPKRKTR